MLLHGLWRTSLSMKPVEWRLEEAGYQVINLTYPSLSHSIGENADYAVSKGVADCRELDFDRISFVTHSLGAFWSGTTCSTMRWRA